MAIHLSFTAKIAPGAIISTVISGSVQTHLINKRRSLIGSKLQKSLKRKTTRRRIVRYSLIAANAAILVAVVGFVVMSSRPDRTAHAVSSSSAAATMNPIDRVTSYDIAANVAQLTKLPESTAITNQAQSAKVAVAVSSSDSNVTAKPQIVATALKSRKDIQSYIVKAGDTVTTIGQKFGVTSDSIRWSNNLTSDTVSAGTTVAIPPVNGIVYTVKAGDTVQSLATKYKANVDQITAYNDAELSGLSTGEQIIIPNGQIQVVATAASIYSATAGSFAATYGSNGYDYGYCTWYVASQIAVPSNWGNANTWAYYAALSGWTVSSAPRVGAIAQTAAGYNGHVAIVNWVSDDGTQIIYRDMNGISGFGRVGTSGVVSASHFEHYIYH